MGTSLGANTALEVASRAPERLRGMVIEMPVLDNALLGLGARRSRRCCVALTFGEPVMKLLARGARAVPRRLLPLLRQRAARHRPPGTGARRRAAAGPVLRAHRAAPQRAAHVHRRPRSCSATGATRCTLLRRRACSPKSCRTARLLEADSLVELRLRPERLTDEIAVVPRRDVGRPTPARQSAEPRRRSQRQSARLTAASQAPAQSELLRRGAGRDGASPAREQFEFVDAHVAGRRGVPTDARRLADPQRDEAERFGRVAQLDLGACASSRRSDGLSATQAGSVIDAGSGRGRWRRRPARSCPAWR